MSEFFSYLKREYQIHALSDITWSHAVNSRERLDKYLSDPSCMMIESDILVSSHGEIIAAHPPAVESDLLFDELLKRVQNSKKGLKLDFKDPEVVKPCLEMVKKAGLKQPIILNADILQGERAAQSKFSPQGFVALCQKYYPQGIFSLGWTTIPEKEGAYTKENVQEMLEICSGLEEVTFPVRASLLPYSWEALQGLLQNEEYSLTIWNNEPVDKALKAWIKEHTDPKKTMYDLIDQDMNSVRI